MSVQYCVVLSSLLYTRHRCDGVCVCGARTIWSSLSCGQAWVCCLYFLSYSRTITLRQWVRIVEATICNRLTEFFCEAEMNKRALKGCPNGHEISTMTTDRIVSRMHFNFKWEKNIFFHTFIFGWSRRDPRFKSQIARFVHFFKFLSVHLLARLGQFLMTTR